MWGMTIAWARATAVDARTVRAHTVVMRAFAATRRRERMIVGASDAMRPLEGVRILLVDDDASIRRAYAMYLESAGADVATASSGIDALRLFAIGPPDIIVADYAMPGMTGFEFLERVRKSGSPRGTFAPAILISALNGLHAAARTAGFNCHLMKPLDPDVLVAEIARLTKK